MSVEKKQRSSLDRALDRAIDRERKHGRLAGNALNVAASRATVMVSNPSSVAPESVAFRASTLPGGGSPPRTANEALRRRGGSQYRVDETPERWVACLDEQYMLVDAPWNAGESCDGYRITDGPCGGCGYCILEQALRAENKFRVVQLWPALFDGDLRQALEHARRRCIEGDAKVMIPAPKYEATELYKTEHEHPPLLPNGKRAPFWFWVDYGEESWQVGVAGWALRGDELTLLAKDQFYRLQMAQRDIGTLKERPVLYLTGKGPWTPVLPSQQYDLRSDTFVFRWGEAPSEDGIHRCLCGAGPKLGRGHRAECPRFVMEITL